MRGTLLQAIIFARMRAVLDASYGCVEHGNNDPIWPAFTANTAAHAKSFLLVLANPTVEPVIMVDRPIAQERRDEWNPFAAPQSDRSQTPTKPDPETAVRRDHLKEESYVKALAIVNFAYVFFCGAYLASRVRILIAHLREPSHAPWIVDPGNIAEQLIVAAIVVWRSERAWVFSYAGAGHFGSSLSWELACF